MKQMWDIKGKLERIIQAVGLNSVPGVRIEGPLVEAKAGDTPEVVCWIWYDNKPYVVEQLVRHKGKDRCTETQSLQDFEEQVREIKNEIAGSRT